MRQILFEIPISQPWDLGPFGKIPVFGFGLVLVLWLTFGAISLWKEWSHAGAFTGEIKKSLVTCLMIAAGIILVPRFAPDTLPVYGYGSMLVVGAFLSGWTASARSKMAGIDPQFCWDLAIKLVLAGVIGSRLFFLIQYHDRVYAGCSTLGDYLLATINLREGGLVLYGGLIAGAAMYFFVCRRRGIDPIKFGDAVVPAVFIGEACGRIGCLLNGCCYGDPTTLPWGLSFPQGSVPWAALVDRGFLLPTAEATFPLHPTQLYSSMNALVLAGLTAVYYRYRAGDGSVLALAVMGYALSRSCLEILRGDELGQFGTILTISQWVSLFVFCGGAALGWWSWMRSHRRLPSASSSLAGNPSAPFRAS